MAGCRLGGGVGGAGMAHTAKGGGGGGREGAGAGGRGQGGMAFGAGGRVIRVSRWLGTGHRYGVLAEARAWEGGAGVSIGGAAGDSFGGDAGGRGAGM